MSRVMTIFIKTHFYKLRRTHRPAVVAVVVALAVAAVVVAVVAAVAVVTAAAPTTVATATATTTATTARLCVRLCLWRELLAVIRTNTHSYALIRNNSPCVKTTEASMRSHVTQSNKNYTGVDPKH